MEEKKEKSLADQKREALLYRQKNGYDRLPREEEKPLEDYCAAYKKFLDNGKTERECANYTVALAEAKGFRPYTRGQAWPRGIRSTNANVARR